MSPARLLAVAGIELRACVTGPLFWALLLALGVATASINPAALLPSGDPSLGGARLFSNSPYAMASLFALSGVLLYSFFASIMAGFAIIRDDECRVSDLLHSTPLSAAEYVLGKLAGILAALGAALLCHLLLAIAFFQIVAGTVSPESVGPFRLSGFLLPALAFAAPMVWLCAGLAFAVGERTRRPVAVFAVPIALFLGCVFFLWRWGPSWLAPGVDRLLMVIDPTGLRWLTRTLFGVDRGVAFYNTRPLAFDATFLWNRMIVLALPLLAILASIRHCRIVATRGTASSVGSPGGLERTAADARGRAFAPRETGGLALTPAPASGDAAARVTPQMPFMGGAGAAGARPGESGLSPPRIARLGMSASPPGSVAGAFQIARSELLELRAHPGLWAIAAIVLVMVWESAASATASLDAPLRMTAGVLAVGAVERITVPVCLLILMMTVESIHRDRTTRFEPLLHSTPVRTAPLLVGRSLAHSLVVLAILLGCSACGMLFLGIQEGGPVEILPFALIWGLILPPTFVTWSAFVTAVMAVVRERAAAYALGFAALMLSAWHHTRDSMSWVWNWNLWGTLRWSDMGIFDLDGRALLLNRLALLALAPLLWAVAARVFSRTARDRARLTRRLAPSSLLRTAAGLAPFAMAPVALGALLAWEIHSGFQGAPARDRAEEHQRLNTEDWSGVASASIAHIDLAVDLEPARRHMKVVGAFRMVNRTDEAMTRLAFTAGAAIEEIAWSLDGTKVRSEDRAGLHVIQPARPLLPGEEIRVGFAYDATFPRGSTRNGGRLREFVLPSGVSLHSMGPNLVPLPGFIEDRGAVLAIPDPFTTRVEVTAPASYTVNAAGVKTAERSLDGRTAVTWESDHPVRALNILAGRWRERRGDGIAIFHHPGHAWNIDEIASTLSAARRRYSEWFHPYPWSELRISEVPSHATSAMGFPTNIPFPEGLGFLTRSDPRAPLAFVVTAHEAAHQWWGNLLAPAEAPGAEVLIEGMAHYSALLLLEAERGAGARIELARRFEESYTGGRRVDAERPLALTGDGSRPGEEAVIFDKGAWVIWMLHNLLGEEGMLAGLRELFARYVDSPDRPVIEDLVETLRPLASDPAAYQAFVEQWLHEVVVPEFRIRDASAVRVDDRAGFAGSPEAGHGQAPAGTAGSSSELLRGAAAGTAGSSTSRNARTSAGMTEEVWEISAVVENIGTGAVEVEIAAVHGQGWDARTRVLLEPGRARRVSWRAGFEPERIVVDPDALVLQLNRSRAVADL